jgi:hypothetical protein
VNVEERMTAIGVGLGPRNRIHEAARQAVLDAAAELQVRRRRVAEAPAGVDTPDGEIVAHGYVGTNDWMRRASAACSELLSVPRPRRWHSCRSACRTTAR